MIISGYAKEKIQEQVQYDIEELTKFKLSYNQKILLYLNASKNINELIVKNGSVQENDYYDSLNKNIAESLNIFEKQIKKIDRTHKTLRKFQKDLKIYELKDFKNRFKQYNENYKIIKNNYINNSIYEENIMLEYACIPWKNKNVNLKESVNENNKIKDNDTLLISEIQNKVILPYKGEEIQQIFEENLNDYQTEQEVIDKMFTRQLSEYKASFSSRFREAYELTTKRDNFSRLDGIQLGIELCGERYLHPAIISACRNIDELDVYLDCLKKNELDDFKIFKIKYELYPMVVENKMKLLLKANLLTRICNFVKRFFSIGKYESKEE